MQLTQKSTASDALSRAEQGESSADITATQRDIELLIAQLGNLLKKLQAAAVSPSQRAVGQRYQDILQDLKNDYDKCMANYARAAQRQELLGGANRAPDSSGKDAAMESLLRERNHINNSLSAADAVIGQAEAVRQDLNWQARSLRNTGGLMGQIASNVPGLNNLIEQIRRRRSRDDKIVAGVIASCVLFTLWYIFG